MNDSEINSIRDLRKIRSAPLLDKSQEQNLFKELDKYVNETDWFTIGIMAPSSHEAICVLRQMETFFKWLPMTVATLPEGHGPVFLKANQNTGDIHVRIEYGLGEGILLGCQYNSLEKFAETLGPFPLNFFTSKE